jgi:hypothetical protein
MTEPNERDEESIYLDLIASGARPELIAAYRLELTAELTAQLTDSRAEVERLRAMIAKMIEHFEQDTCPYCCDECQPIAVLDEARDALAAKP